MKRVAIITYSRAYNYGSALQTYALNRYLTQLGNKVNTIDYTTKEQQILYAIFEPIKGLMSFVRNIQSLIYYTSIKRHRGRFESFLLEWVPMTQRIQIAEDFARLNNQFDCFLCGSDQIWNAQCDDFDSNYMLSFVTDKSKCISYAPSLGAGERNEKTISALSQYVKGYKAVSTREESSAPIIEKASNVAVETVLDPVFLLDPHDWDEVATDCPIKGDYILGYFIGDVAGMREFAAQLSKETECPVVVIYKSIRDIKYRFQTYYEAGPAEFISLIKNARYIVTNSFHAVSFSIIYGVSFWAFVQSGSSDERIRNILRLVGLENRIVADAKIWVDKQKGIDYENINRGNLDDMIEKSKTFLKNNICNEPL